MGIDVIVNGKFMADRMQGIVRYGRELLLELDKLLSDYDSVTLALPKNVHDVPQYRRIECVKVGNLSGILWEQVNLAQYLSHHPKSLCLNFCNVAPIFAKPGVTTIHDVMYKVNPQDYTTLRNRLSRLWHLLQYALVTRREQVVLTDSEFSKGELERWYPESRGKIEIVPCGWQHVFNMPRDESIFSKYPILEKGNYFLTCATRSKNKNGKWILEVARRNPDLRFVIAGGSYEPSDSDIPNNAVVLGFVSDGELRSLIEHCRAFLFPSLYEGFGLPPLEAIALGAPVISSDSASLPEILGDSAEYIKPNFYDVDMRMLAKNASLKPRLALDRYSWKQSASLLFMILKKRSSIHTHINIR